MRTLILCVIGLLPVANGQIGNGINFYSTEKEIAMGRALAQEFERQVTVLDDSSVQQYIEQLGNRLVARLPVDAPVFPYRFQVTAASGATVLEPSTFPGGFVFVPANLILAAQDEAELAGALAHAIAHVASRHGTRQETRGQIANYATLPLIFMGGGWSDYSSRQASQVLIPLGFLKFARAYELEADRIAVETIAAAGYDPTALLTFADRTQPAPSAGTTSQYISAFPTRSERLDNLRSAIARLPAPPAFPEIQNRVRRLN
jgi:predicted Zn-dependent protease